MDELDAMRGGRTLIVIAHRLSTVQNCHCLYLLNEGHLIAQGSYDELINSSSEFRKMAQNNLTARARDCFYGVGYRSLQLITQVLWCGLGRYKMRSP